MNGKWVFVRRLCATVYCGMFDRTFGIGSIQMGRPARFIWNFYAVVISVFKLHMGTNRPETDTIAKSTTNQYLGVNH